MIAVIKKIDGGKVRVVAYNRLCAWGGEGLLFEVRFTLTKAVSRTEMSCLTQNKGTPLFSLQHFAYGSHYGFTALKGKKKNIKSGYLGIVVH